MRSYRWGIHREWKSSHMALGLSEVHLGLKLRFINKLQTLMSERSSVNVGAK